jgi:hypothetical protein
MYAGGGSLCLQVKFGGNFLFTRGGFKDKLVMWLMKYLICFITHLISI